jgi:hypothetical protein
MSFGSTFLLAALAVGIICVAVSAASKRPGTAWNYYHFDGSGFVAGQPLDNGPFLAVQDRTVPVRLTRASKAEKVPMPPGSGALAGICYIQSSGGKLGSGHGYTPCPGLPVTISSGESIVLRTQSDESGHFVSVLPSGSYRVASGAFSAEATVENGSTTLVPLRTGKRMVD